MGSTHTPNLPQLRHDWVHHPPPAPPLQPTHGTLDSRVVGGSPLSPSGAQSRSPTEDALEEERAEREGEGADRPDAQRLLSVSDSIPAILELFDEPAEEDGPAVGSVHPSHTLAYALVMP